MSKRLTCQHVETQCNYVAEAETVDEVMKKIIDHATKIHKAPREIFENKEQIERMIAAIREPPEDTYPQTLKRLETFIASALLLQESGDARNYNSRLLRYAAMNPGNAIADGALEKLYLAAGRSTLKDIAESAAVSISIISKHVAISLRKVIAVFDYTEEDYSGVLDRTFIHEWSRQPGAKTRFKFLTCSVFNDSLMFPVFSIPAQVGNNTAEDVEYIRELLQKNKIVGEVIFSLYGKELYSSEFLGALKKTNKPYLTLVQDSQDIRNGFAAREDDDEIRLERLFCFADEKNKERNDSYSGFLRSVFGKESGDYLSWCFVKNIEDSELNTLVSAYTQGWQIWDRVRSREYSYIRADSEEMQVQYFLFSYCMLLRAHWVLYYMEEDVDFDRYLAGLRNLCSE